MMASGPPTFTTSQLSGFAAVLSTARQQLATGDQAGALQSITQYYQSQSAAGRGYASDAIEVVNNTGVYGQVANALVANAVGRSLWASERVSVALNLATADLAVMQANGGYIPTQVDIENYHSTVFNSSSIPFTAWGGYAFASLGLDWSSKRSPHCSFVMRDGCRAWPCFQNP